jgi:hypothetical protein
MHATCAAKFPTRTLALLWLGLCVVSPRVGATSKGKAGHPALGNSLRNDCDCRMEALDAWHSRGLVILSVDSLGR